MFFALNSGRAGSRTLAQVLSQSPNCLCQHEPEPRFIAEATRYRYGDFDPAELAARLSRSRTPVDEGRVYGETNNKLALMVPVLRDVFPDARFLWLVRDGRAAVASALQRGWFSDAQLESPTNAWHRWRLRGDLVGEVSAEEWQSWTQLERVAWLWAYTNRLIRSDMQEAEPGTWRTARVETLAQDLPEICDFLGLQPTRFVLGRANERTTGDATDGAKGSFEAINVVDRLATWQEWDTDERATFTKHAGDLMDALYPRWRDAGGWLEVEADVSRNATVVVDPRRGDAVTAPDELDHVRADVAELKMLRGELRMLLKEHQRLQTQHGRTTERLQREQRGHELTKASLRLMRRQHRRVAERAIAAGEVQAEISSLRAEIDRLAAGREAQGRLEERIVVLEERLREERDRAAAAEREYRELERSQSYRIGHALVRAVKSPVLLIRWLRRKPRVTSATPKAPTTSADTTSTETGDHVPDARSTSAPHGPLGICDVVVAIGLRVEEYGRILGVLESDRERRPNQPVVLITDLGNAVTLASPPVRVELLPTVGGNEPNSGTWRRRISELIEIYEPSRVFATAESAPLVDDVRAHPISL